MTPAVYLDHAATTPLRAEVRAAMAEALDTAWGNPSSVHAAGRRARAALEDARARLAAVLGARPAEIVFTRGGTEADNLAVLGRAALDLTRPVAVSATEHKAVLSAAKAAGAPLVVLPVDADGVVRMEAVDDVLRDHPSVVSVMWANNETGAVQPVAALAARCAEAGVAFHADAVQALGKLVVRVDRVSAALLSFSAHKLGGPRGTGALFVRAGTEVAPRLHGGGQERGLRPGTEDVAGAVGMALAAELAEAERAAEAARLGALRDRLEAALRARVPALVVNAAGAERLPTISNVSAPGADAQMLLPALDAAGLAVSSGSACASGAVTPSHVLTAMGVGPEAAGPSVRFSLGHMTTDEDVDRAIDVFPAVVARLRG